MYRLPQSWVGPKLPWKSLHAGLHLLAFIFTVVGLVAVFRFHSHGKIAHLYSLHSWLGITTVILFASQVGLLLTSSLDLYCWAEQPGAPWLGLSCVKRASQTLPSNLIVGRAEGGGRLPSFPLLVLPLTHLSFLDSSGLCHSMSYINVHEPLLVHFPLQALSEPNQL